MSRVDPDTARVIRDLTDKIADVLTRLATPDIGRAVPAPLPNEPLARKVFPPPTGPMSPADREAGYVIGCDGWATTAEVAEVLKVDQRTVRRMVERGQIRAIKLDDARQGGVRLCIRSIHEFIQNRKV